MGTTRFIAGGPDGHRDQAHVEMAAGEHRRLPAIDPLEMELRLAFFAATAAMEAAVDAELAEYGLSHPRFNILMVLRSTDPIGAGIPMGTLATHVMTTARNATGLVDLLERRGLVSRASDPADRRLVLVRRTREADELLDELLPRFAARMSAALTGYSEAEKRLFVDQLNRLRLGLTAITPETAAPEPESGTPAAAVPR
ncbi:MarR family winged helix-turn-helix transcriptional regulator [Rhizohabitans arisaemae]|uniref:MarR family winged helix-turn-helix transcriptional regulator n=1 Tax=Rhizohabitans arisaemae TaxID=2720610 RepID=UPI0024B1E77E|nr:MarR family transcriptional regulator [Rhizohabitans arisaemae]